MLSAPLRSVENPEGIDPAEVQSYFVRHGRYSAGTMTRYSPSVLTGTPAHQDLAQGFEIGTRFHSAPVIRFADAKPMQLGDINRADGRWRLLAFADAADRGSGGGAIAKLCEFLQSAAASPLVRYTAPDADCDSVIDLRAVFQQAHRALNGAEFPDLLRPRKGRLSLQDYEKVFTADVENGPDIFDVRGIDRSRGCVVVIRPDQYVAHILPLDDHAGLARFFDGFMVPAR